MSLVAISDLHIRFPRDQSSKILRSFLDHPKTKEASHIIFLGDIFDLMIGYSQEYFKLYDFFFKELEVLLKAGKFVFYVEGNHDFHLRKLFKKFFSGRKIEEQFRLVDDWLELDLQGKKIRISHGDELDYQNQSYQLTKKFLKSGPIEIVANNAMNLSWMHSFGLRASRMSRNQGRKHFNADLTKAKFRLGAQALFSGDADIYLGGHSHVQDFFHWDNRTYINNGDPRISEKFIGVDAQGGHLHSLN